MRVFHRTASLDVGTARQSLRRDFPQVPERVVFTVLDAYLQNGSAIPAAVKAASVRIADACAVE